MYFGGQTFRAFRPSHFAQPDELGEEGDQARQANIRLYRERAAAQLPLFEQVNLSDPLDPGRSLPAV